VFVNDGTGGSLGTKGKCSESFYWLVLSS
jgi:hypothetical protein